MTISTATSAHGGVNRRPKPVYFITGNERVHLGWQDERGELFTIERCNKSAAVEAGTFEIIDYGAAEYEGLDLCDHCLG